MSGPHEPSVRAHVVWRPGAPCAVIVVKRGRTFCSLRWDLATDRVELGQWSKFKVYLPRCDISSDGRFWSYFALDGRWDSPARGSWSVVARVPWMSAMYVFPQGDTWGGGLSFDEDGAVGRLVTRRATYPLGHSPRRLRLPRCGWERDGDTSSRPLGGGWELVKVHPQTDNRREHHHLRHVDGRSVELPGWDWADRLVPDGRVVWSRGGVLRTTSAAVLASAGGDVEHLDTVGTVILDASALTFTPRAPPSPRPAVFVDRDWQILDARSDHGL